MPTPKRQIISPEQPQQKSSPSFRSIARVPPGSEPDKLPQRYHIRVGSPWWYPDLARPFCPRSCSSCALETPITRAEIFARASLAHSPPAIDSSKAVRHRRQYCRGHIFQFQKILVFLLLAYPITQQTNPLSRAHGFLRRLRIFLTA